MGKTWFTGDFHLGHANIIEYASRPFKTVREMNETIISNHNELVGKNDIVYFLGDLCFEKDRKAEDCLGQLNGKFCWVKGNHDECLKNLVPLVSECVIMLGGREVFLVHDPANHQPYFKVNLTAHVHAKWKVHKAKSGKSMCLNVGCDVWNYKPAGSEEVIKEIQKEMRW